MKVFKFGGASINSDDRFRNTARIIDSVKEDKLMIVISAMGKTTNALETVAHDFFEGRREAGLDGFEVLKKQHLEVLESLVPSDEEGKQQLQNVFTEIEWLLHDKPVRTFDYYYDQIVCCGELLSSLILQRFLHSQKMNCRWVDARDIIRTDNNFREGLVDWEVTASQISGRIKPLFDTTDIIITQGFIGSTDENESTTLGREGSDYTAAIFTNLLPAESLTIWKDVDAVMNADPRIFPEAVKLTALSYTEVIEMAYYGAQVIHPKTIKPLQNHNIPLFVKSFIDPTLPGSVISHKSMPALPPIIVLKEKQVMMRFSSKDFSFVEDKPVEALHKIFGEVRMKPNLTQNAAISLLCCFDDRPEKTDQLAAAAAEMFDVTLERDLTLLTVRHYDEATLRKMTEGKTTLLEQRTPETAQMLMRRVS